MYYSMKKIVFILFLNILFANSNFSQGYFNQWYFGHKAGLDFNSGSPVVKYNGEIFTDEGCATISDYDGNLLFYTDGVTIWNKNHKPMVNGTGLKGHFSSTQSALIVPFPNNNRKYYIFTVSNNLSDGELRYSIVDMAIDNGNGGIISLKKNILLGTNFTEKLVAAKANCGVWVLTHKRDNSDFYAYLIEGTKISQPIITTIGSAHYKYAYTGTMKVSPNNKKIALATLTGIVELFDFNRNTGNISNAITFPIDTGINTYGVCFSPNNKLLYVGQGYSDLTTPNTLFQYDISRKVDTLIFESKKPVGFPTSPTTKVFDIQIGPNNKLYISRPETSFLDIITNPNDIGFECNYIKNAINCGNNKVRPGLPNALIFPSKTIDIDLGKDTTICNGDTLALDATIVNSTYLWQDNSTNPKFTIKKPGQYWVKVTNSCGNSIGTINVEYTSLPYFDLGNDTTLCNGEKLTLDISMPDVTYLWQDDSNDSIFTVDTAGKYWVKVTNSCGSFIDTIEIDYTTIPTIELGNDTTLCEGENLLLDATTADVSYLWQDNSNDSTFTVDTAGKYWVHISNSCGSNSDTINIAYKTKPSLELGNDTILCKGEKLLLDATTEDATYLWQNLSNNPTFIVSEQGKYKVKVTNLCGASIDSINIGYTTIPSIDLGNDTTLCEGTGLILNATSPHSIYLWQDNTTDSIFNVEKSGIYWVKIENACGYNFDTINIDYITKPLIELGNDTTLCKREKLILNATSPNASYLWQDNSIDSSLLIDKAGKYWVKVRNLCGNSYDTINIVYTTIPIIELGNDTTLCKGEKLILNVSYPDASYLWQDNSTDSLLIVNNAGKYWAKVSNKCGFIQDTISIDYYPKPSIELGADTTLCIGEDLILNATTPNASYIWQDGSVEPVFTVSEEGTYWVRVNYCGITEDTINVQYEDCNCSLYIPNIFTPNDDSVNDIFSPSSNCTLSKYHLIIFNRWGEKLFETNNAKTPWDETFKDKPLPNGVYVYLLRYKYEDKEEFESVYGDITLIR